MGCKLGEFFERQGGGDWEVATVWFNSFQRMFTWSCCRKTGHREKEWGLARLKNCCVGLLLRPFLRVRHRTAQQTVDLRPLPRLITGRLTNQSFICSSDTYRLAFS